MHAHEASIKAAVAILTVSDTRSTTDDQSGAIIADCLEAAGHQVIHRELVRDDETEITIRVSGWSTLFEVDAIVVTGGTGASTRDVTPEAILPLFSASVRRRCLVERMLDGLTKELLVHQSFSCPVRQKQ